ncbi:bifunctional 4-hydroxy-2-oxoglutarate aldolase/2-dehydro-3-deoxy-phosphogluconate aldolase [Marinigracilibium pacificum]|uniref:Bifunctional 4-hydroxy-2-oxoglutarate aldolase/2-dehydro-3-deoxy-phosphogluconate aldolase n=1 Tax=Marinigracilibium pacificum TaxID=2729599 RepID=A0A848IX41_9BACT|nr:bifunctional 4-hydroxy-2-oxoglutarate aldolase/2-dehydro-3-deoxy-phosphogluconate aldolase [Marinigracilibium pacificum]NMM48877.1 bifunctional 4-hydroxy-2-oxoglutarate aldolase/2-dehydro-3-deoxy-phosphogluconate aldolase [Marinigracilibium pacificum]
MAKYNRNEVIDQMMETGIIPVFYHPDVDICKNILQSCYDGGIRVFEFTNRGEGSFRIYEELQIYVNKFLPDLILGIGSIIDAPTSANYISIGANFIVSPIFNPEIAKICNRQKIAWVPGCGSLTEISNAEEYGADLIKIFPARQVGGPEFIKAIHGPCPWTKIMPTGGVNPTKADLIEWFSAGAHCVGIGSKLITSEIIQNKSYDDLTLQIKSLLDIVKEIR